MLDIQDIKALCNENKIAFTQHFMYRIETRGIIISDIRLAITNGEIIEQYPNEVGKRLQNKKGGKTMTCFYCKGTAESSTTKHFADLDTCVVIIKSVPCHKCTQCGEVIYDVTVGERIEQIVSNLKNSLTEIAVIQYSNVAA